MLGLVAAWRQQVDNDQGAPRPLLSGVYAQAGTFNNAPATAANDIPSALRAVLFIWLWNCAINRANLSGNCLNSSIPRQTTSAQNFSTHPAETRTIPAFPNCQAKIFSPTGLCQINTPLTVW
ncbi:hypothetical protein [Azonexus sp.]|uniref:hypothetical protein n=1 Tax=Azonexus sp. TaxID=1872668 RepID=UPI0027B9B565|nr:hypothetical protein [Azonexus sp.]